MLFQEMLPFVKLQKETENHPIILKIRPFQEITWFGIYISGLVTHVVSITGSYARC